MARVTVEDCLEKIVDQFALVHLATARYRQLHRGADRLVESKNKNIVTALREIATGKVSFREPVQETVLQHSRLTQAYSTMGDDDLDNNTPLI